MNNETLHFCLPCTIPILKDYRSQVISEKWYLDPNLKLQKLARKLSISPNKLSELINQTDGTNFNQFINKLRIQHAKSLIAANPEISNDDIVCHIVFKIAISQITYTPPRLPGKPPDNLLTIAWKSARRCRLIQLAQHQH